MLLKNVFNKKLYFEIIKQNFLCLEVNYGCGKLTTESVVKII